MWDFLNAPSEALLVSTCFEILGGPCFYEKSELLNLQLQACDPAEKSALKSFLLVHRDGLVELFEGYLAHIRPSARKQFGMVFTPESIVRSMVKSSLTESFERVIDCGCGSGRFALCVAELAQRGNTTPSVVAVDVDPLACLLTLTASRIKKLQVNVIRTDFLDFDLEGDWQKTLFIGNPPYVRHHDMSARQKESGKKLALSVGLNGWSKLAGLHACFIVKCLSLAKKDDQICFITSSEWLDVKYGKALRDAFSSNLGGGLELVLFDAQREVFEGVMSTALISRWAVGKDSNKKRLTFLEGASTEIRPGREIDSETLASADTWSGFFTKPFTCPAVLHNTLRPKLGDMFSVSRGVVTGCNNFFVLASDDNLVKSCPTCFAPVIAHAKEVLSSGGIINADALKGRLLVCSEEAIEKYESLREYLELGRQLDVHEGYIASHRRNWWKIEGKPAPIVSTYMTRTSPAFARNPEGCLSLNTVHGLYPRENMTDEQIEAVVLFLNQTDFSHVARTYQGGLKKIEPRDMEKAPIPPLEIMVERWQTQCQRTHVS